MENVYRIVRRYEKLFNGYFFRHHRRRNDGDTPKSVVREGKPNRLLYDAPRQRTTRKRIISGKLC